MTGAMIRRFARKPSSASDVLAVGGATASEELGGLPQRAFVPRPDSDSGPATDILFGRFTPKDIAEVEDHLEADHRAMWEYATPAERKRLALALGLHYNVRSVIEHVGLSPATPPPAIHSMVHGWISEIGGSYYLADLVLEGLDTIETPLRSGDLALDFSCSSGRVVRPLAAARPDAQWHACDPNAEAIAWARENLAGIEFFVSDTNPPLPFEPGTLDLAFAISVWSHYSAQAALRWLEEMHRVIKPGGHLLLTTHGLQACVWFTVTRDPAIEAKLGAAWITDTVWQLEHAGHCFWDVFGETGDWGVVDSEWGLAFFTPEWLLENVTPAWALRSYRIGRAHGNQDVYVLQRQ
jgi:SAM-dependent methyltransferase